MRPHRFAGRGLIPDPFYRDNETNLQWIDKASWEYKCEFEVSPAMGPGPRPVATHGTGHLRGVNLNGTHLQSTDNMFRGGGSTSSPF
ncbi:MAG: hypothetical protein R2751_01155 [Bacteroidales bacterium]